MPQCRGETARCEVDDEAVEPTVSRGLPPDGGFPQNLLR